MDEKIYTIPVNEAFDEYDGCPFCRMRRKLEDNERELIMGASMMEPSIRIKTNKTGFCKKHFDKMFAMNNRLSLALMLESHLDEVSDNTVIWKKSIVFKDNSKKAVENMKKIKNDCYICQNTLEKFEKMMFCAVLLWNTQPEFREKTKKQQYFCLEHASEFVETASLKLDKKQYAQFLEDVSTVQSEYIASLKEDVSWFCKKFDYRYENEPWGNAKNSVERAIKFLEGDY